MSTATPTRIFGIRIGLDPKILVGSLLVFAALLFWYNSRGDEGGGTPANPPAAAVSSEAVAPLPSISSGTRPVRRSRITANDRGVLRLRAVNGSRGDVDPTLRLDLLTRLQSVKMPSVTRSLFAIGPSAQQIAATAAANGPIIPVRPLQSVQPQGISNAPPAAAVVNIPLRFYGFARPAVKGANSRGLFMDNDNVIVASEGELIKGRYLVVELTPNSARMEDVQMKQGQTLPVVPEASTQ